MGQLNDILSKASDIVWGIPLLVLLVGTGLYLTIQSWFSAIPQHGLCT